MTGLRVLYARDVAQLLGWRTERAHDWMLRNGIATKEPKGRRYYTTATRIRDAFPDIAEELVMDVGEGGAVSDVDRGLVDDTE